MTSKTYLNYKKSYFVAYYVSEVKYMIICKNRTDLQSVITKIKAQGKSLGFVPTMGALHQGHISLIHQSVKTWILPVQVFFVNPTQFNNPQISNVSSNS
jgi:hypothetical protein